MWKILFVSILIIFFFGCSKIKYKNLTRERPANYEHYIYHQTNPRYEAYNTIRETGKNVTTADVRQNDTYLILE